MVGSILICFPEKDKRHEPPPKNRRKNLKHVPMSMCTAEQLASIRQCALMKKPIQETCRGSHRRPSPALTQVEETPANAIWGCRGTSHRAGRAGLMAA